MLFERRLREGIHEDRIVLAFRRWRRCQVVAGHRYLRDWTLLLAAAVTGTLVLTAAAEAGWGRHLLRAGS